MAYVPVFARTLITAAEYEALPEDICRTIEVVDGHIVKCETPSRLHNRVVRRLATVLELARKPEPCLMVETDVDVRISDVPLNFRKPDVTLYRCLPDDRRLHAGDAVLVIEVVSPDSSHFTDTVEKKAVYAAAGIGVYLIVFLDVVGEGIEKIEEYWLEPGGVYRLVQLHTRRLELKAPVRAEAEFDELTTP